MNASTSGQCMFRTVKGTTLGRVEKGKAGGNQVLRITKLDTKKTLFNARNLQSDRDRVINELRKLSNVTGKGKQYDGQ